MAEISNVSRDEELRTALELLKKHHDQLVLLHAPLRQLLSDLEDTNSSFPETRAFLKARGLTNVRHLNEEGKEELARHLWNVLFKENPEKVA